MENGGARVLADRAVSAVFNLSQDGGGLPCFLLPLAVRGDYRETPQS